MQNRNDHTQLCGPSLVIQAGIQPVGTIWGNANATFLNGAKGKKPLIGPDSRFHGSVTVEDLRPTVPILPEAKSFTAFTFFGLFVAATALLCVVIAIGLHWYLRRSSYDSHIFPFQKQILGEPLVSNLY